MCTIRERTNPFAVLCNRELSYSIKELSNTANMPAIWKHVGKESSLIQLQSSLIELEKRAL